MFYSEPPREPVETPTVNIFKIYAPRQIFLNGFKQKQEMEDFRPRDKQMMSPTASILDRIMADEIFPQEPLGDEPFYYNDFEHSYEPQASNIISRKLPAFHEPEYPTVHDFDYESEYDPFQGNRIGEPIRNEIPFAPNFYSDHVHHENCEHEQMLQRIQPPVHEFNDYSDNYPINEDFMRAPSFTTHFKPPTVTLHRVSPLLTLFGSIAAGQGPINTQFDDNVTPSFGYAEQELLNTVLNAEAQNGNKGPISAVIIEEIEDKTPVDEDVVEINRNFIKTILPDNTSITEEIDSDNSDQLDESPMDEIEINVVETILPDNSVTVTETVEEKLNNEVS